MTVKFYFTISFLLLSGIVFLNIFSGHHYEPRIEYLVKEKRDQSPVSSCFELEKLVEVEATFHARIKPWTWNITNYSNSKGLENLNMNYESISDDYGEYIASKNLTVYTGQLLKLTFMTLDTEQGIGIWSGNNEKDYPLLKDLFTHPINYTLPRQNPVTIYLQAPKTAPTLIYRSTLFSGAGHSLMYGFINIIDRVDNTDPESIIVAQDLNCNVTSPGSKDINEIPGYEMATVVFTLIFTYILNKLNQRRYLRKKKRRKF